MTGRAAAALAQDASWERALEQVLEQVEPVRFADGGVDLALLFASGEYGDGLQALVRRARSETGASVLIGCSGVGIIGGARELEGPPALALLVLRLPGAVLHPLRVDRQALEQLAGPSDWHTLSQAPPDEVNGWLVFADPFRLPVERLVGGLSAAYPDRPLIGGLASGPPQTRQSRVFLDDQVYDDGAVAVSLGGDYALRTVVSQGAEPISQPWTITATKGHLVRTIGQRPALELLLETIRDLPPEQRRRAQQNLLVGLAIDEYRESFGRGDFLIRNLTGVDRESGVVAIGAHPRVGQTIQFQLRDAIAADEELRALLGQEREQRGQPPLAVLLCTCTGRGSALFGSPDHDASLVADLLGTAAIAGFFCNGEIGPVGGKNFVHGYTASLGLIVPTD